MEEEAKAKVAFDAQLLWLKEFIDENPSIIRVGELELRHANGRLKEALQAWTSNTILPPAHVWRKLLPDGNKSSVRMKSWVEKLQGHTRPNPRRGVETGERFRQQASTFTEAWNDAVKRLRVRRGKQKSQHKRHFTKHFLEASANREKRNKASAAIQRAHRHGQYSN
jgi:hypothetical protein